MLYGYKWSRQTLTSLLRLCSTQEAFAPAIIGVFYLCVDSSFRHQHCRCCGHLPSSISFPFVIVNKAWLAWNSSSDDGSPLLCLTNKPTSHVHLFFAFFFMCLSSSLSLFFLRWKSAKFVCRRRRRKRRRQRRHIATDGKMVASNGIDWIVGAKVRNVSVLTDLSRFSPILERWLGRCEEMGQVTWGRQLTNGGAEAFAIEKWCGCRCDPHAMISSGFFCIAPFLLVLFLRLLFAISLLFCSRACVRACGFRYGRLVLSVAVVSRNL